MSRDFEYEKNNIGFDIQCPNGGIKCKNYEFCEAVLPDWWYECKECYFCTNCDISGFKKNPLEFRSCLEELPQSDNSSAVSHSMGFLERCSVCHEFKTRFMKFPACSHWFCVGCSRDILWDNSCRYYLDPVQFGCPPCPNKCKNPKRGFQCGCEEYDEIQDKWREEFPEQYNAYNEEEEESIEKGSNYGEIYCSKRCFICRKKHKSKY